MKAEDVVEGYIDMNCDYYNQELASIIDSIFHTARAIVPKLFDILDFDISTYDILYDKYHDIGKVLVKYIDDNLESILFDIFKVEMNNFVDKYRKGLINK